MRVHSPGSHYEGGIEGNCEHCPWAQGVVMSIDNEGRYMTVDHVEIEETGDVDLQQHPPLNLRP